ncbi:hypothetical protein YC2023_098674 [Brassica napus]
MDARGNDKDACGTVRMVRRMRMHVRLWFLHHPSQVWHDPRQVWHDPSQVWHDLSHVWHDLSQVWHDPSQVWYGEKHEPRLKCSERPELHAELVPCNNLWTAAHHYVTMRSRDPAPGIQISLITAMRIQDQDLLLPTGATDHLQQISTDTSDLHQPNL